MNSIYDFKVALVTGAAKGMGPATARMFAESGASVVLADMDSDLPAKEAERIVVEGGTAIGIACDVTDEGQVAAMVDRVSWIRPWMQSHQALHLRPQLDPTQKWLDFRRYTIRHCCRTASASCTSILPI